MSSSFQYLKWGLEDLIDRVWYQAEFRISAMSQYVILGHGAQEYRGAIVTRNHKTRSEQSVVTGIDSRVCLPGFSRSNERRVDGDYGFIK